jgi:hypothetical protein
LECHKFSFSSGKNSKNIALAILKYFYKFSVYKINININERILYTENHSVEDTLYSYCKVYGRTIYGFHISGNYLIAKLITEIDTTGTKIMKEIYISKLKMDF